MLINPSFGSCVVAVDHQCWCEGSAYQKQQGRASWDIYVTFTPRRGISPLRPSLLVPEPRLLLKLVTRIAAFPILESRGSGPEQSEDIIFLVSSIKSLWKIWNLIIVTCLDEAKAMHIVRPQALMSWMWGCGETGAFCKSY